MIKSPSNQDAIASLYSPFPSLAEAERVSDLLLKEKLIACANILPGATSIYSWDGKTQKETEVIVFFKTTLSHVKKAIQKIEELHPYEVPAVIQFEALANSSYAQWIKNSVEEQGSER